MQTRLPFFDSLRLSYHPILFSTSMVQSILRGEKTQTRRIINPQPKDCSETHKEFKEAEWQNDPVKFSDKLNPSYWYCSLCGNGATFEKPGFKCRYKVGDILWVRETFCPVMPPMMPGDDMPDWCNYIYKASD